MQTIIRKDHTLDRPDFRVTAEEVFDALKSLHEDNDIPAFTTCDISDILADKFRGVSYERIERSVRAGMSWLCEREVAYIAGESVKTTAAGCISRPFIYALYPGRTWNKQKREMVRSACDFQLLNSVFCR